MPRVTSLSTSGSSLRSPWDSTTSGYETSPHPPSPAPPVRVNPAVGGAASRGPRLALSVGHMRPSHSAPEAPTHLRAGDLPPGLLDHLDPIDAPRSDRDRDRSSRSRSHSSSASASCTKRRAEPAALPEIPQIPAIDDHSIVSVSRSYSAFSMAPRVRTEPASGGAAAGRRPRATPAPHSPHAAPT